MSTSKRKFKKQTTSKILAETLAPRRRVEVDKLFDKNYLTGLGRFMTKVKSQVKKIND